jgi:chemotaxis signal transduction protein
MKKKKILYSEFAPVARPATAAPQASPAPPPPAPRQSRTSAPIDLARTLAAAAAPVPVQPLARLITPLRGVPRMTPGRAVSRITPARAVSRITPLRGMPVLSGVRTVRERVRARTGQLELLLFRVASERFAIELGTVEEAIDLPPIHHVPEMPPAMLGVITVRGTLTPVYSPAAALGLGLTDGASALIFKRGRARFAVVIDDVEDVMTLDLALLRDAPGVDAGEGILLGVVRQRDALLALVDTETLLATCQAVPLLETA